MLSASLSFFSPFSYQTICILFLLLTSFFNISVTFTIIICFFRMDENFIEDDLGEFVKNDLGEFVKTLAFELELGFRFWLFSNLIFFYYYFLLLAYLFFAYWSVYYLVF